MIPGEVAFLPHKHRWMHHWMGGLDNPYSRPVMMQIQLRDPYFVLESLCGSEVSFLCTQASRRLRSRRQMFSLECFSPVRHSCKQPSWLVLLFVHFRRCSLSLFLPTRDIFCRILEVRD